MLRKTRRSLEADTDKENRQIDLTSTILRPLQPDKSFFPALSSPHIQLSPYAAEIEGLWRSQESLLDCSNPLHLHEVPASSRAKLVNWMMEVMDLFECSRAAFFLAVRVLDCFFRQTGKCVLEQDLHLLGVVCMFVASKFEDVNPLSMKVVHERIGHRKFTKGEIKRGEREVLTALEFHVSLTTVYLFLEKYLLEVGLESEEGQRAQAVSQLAMLSWQLAVLPPSKLAKAVQTATRASLHLPVLLPRHGPDALAFQELASFLENYRYNYEECRAVAYQYPDIDFGSFLRL